MLSSWVRCCSILFGWFHPFLLPWLIYHPVALRWSTEQRYTTPLVFLYFVCITLSAAIKTKIVVNMATGSETVGRTMHVSFLNSPPPASTNQPRLQLIVHPPLKQDQRHSPPVTEVDIEVFLTFSPCLYGYIKSVTPNRINIGVYIYFYRENSFGISSNHNLLRTFNAQLVMFFCFLILNTYSVPK